MLVSSMREKSHLCCINVDNNLCEEIKVEHRV